MLTRRNRKRVRRIRHLKMKLKNGQKLIERTVFFYVFFLGNKQKVKWVFLESQKSSNTYLGIRCVSHQFCQFFQKKSSGKPWRFFFSLCKCKFFIGKGPFKPLMFTPKSGYALNVFFGSFKHKIMFFLYFWPSLDVSKRRS